MRDRSFAVRYLAGTALAAQLPCRLDQQEQPIHAGMAIGKAAAIGVDRDPRAACPAGRSEDARRDAAALDKSAAFALRAEAEILEEQDRVDCECVIQLDDVDIARAEARHLIS